MADGSSVEKTTKGCGRLEEDLRNVLGWCLDSEELSDVTIHGFEDENGAGTMQEIKAHRLVLAARSKVFRDRFARNGPWEGRHDVKCEVTDYRVMKAMVKFMYTDGLERYGNSAFMAKLYEAARVFEVSRLQSLAGEALAEMVQTSRSECDWFSNALAVYEFASRPDKSNNHDIDPKLTEIVLQLISSQIKSSENGKAALFRAMHDDIICLVEQIPRRCFSFVCARLLLELFSENQALESAILIGRADIVVEFLSKGIDPDTPTTMDELLPVELALNLSKLTVSRTLPSYSSDMHNQLPDEAVDNTSPRYSIHSITSGGGPSRLELGYDVDWLNPLEVTEIVETLIMGGSRHTELDHHHQQHQQQQHRQPMLNLASRIGNARHVRALLDAGTDVNEFDPVTGRTALHEAAENGFVGVIQVLLDAKIIPNQQDTNGCTALHLCARRGHLECVDVLQPVCNVQIPDQFGWTALHHSCRKGHAEVTRRLLQQCRDPMGLALATEYDQGSTAIHLAASNANYRVMLVFFEMAREMDQDQYPPTTTTMRIANVKDLESRTPLHRACITAFESIFVTTQGVMAQEMQQYQQGYDLFRRSIKVIETLADAGSDVMSLTKLNYTPLHFCLGGAQTHKLTTKQQDPNEYFRVERPRTSQDGQSEKLYAKMTRKLLATILGVPGGLSAIRTTGKDRVTPLHCAVRSFNPYGAAILVKRGADINARDKVNESPLSLARGNWPLPTLINSLLKPLSNPEQVTWVEDQAKDHCEGCKVAFSVTTRRHHCRLCREIFCSSCTSNKASIPSFGIEQPARVCAACNEALSWPEVDDGSSFGEAPSTLDESFSSDFQQELQQEQEIVATAKEEEEEENSKLVNQQPLKKHIKVKRNGKSKLRRQVSLD